jgi:hypothetical protein
MERSWAWAAERWLARRDSWSARREARSVLLERAEARAWWEARREGWMEEGELVRALRRAGLVRMSAMSCFLFHF